MSRVSSLEDSERTDVSGGCFATATARVQFGYLRARCDIVTVGDEQRFDGSGLRRVHTQISFVRFDFGNGFVGGDLIADLLQQSNSSVFDGLGKRRCRDIDRLV